MARGYLSGILWGTGASAFGLAVLSLAAPLPQPPEAVTQAPADAADMAPADDRAGSDADAGEGFGDATGATGRDADLVELPPTAPAETETDPDTLDPMAGADTEPAGLPEVSDSGGALDAPASGADAAGVTVDPGVAPAAPSARAQAPAEPAEQEVELSISTEPAQPVLPEVSEDSGFGAAPVADTAPQVDSRADPQIDAPEGEQVARPGAADGEVAVDETPAAPPPPADQPRLAALPQIGTDDAGDAAADNDTGAPDGQPDAASGDLPLPGSATAPPSRLPMIGEAGSSPATPDVPAPPENAGAPGLPPIEAFAEPFDNPEDLPLMSIVLIDEPGSLGIEALADFPYPLTFAIDPTQPDAVEKMRAHRAAGFEVVALIDLPAAAQPVDAEVSIAASLDVLNQSVAVLEGTGSGIQGNRPLSDQVTDILAVTGHGLITQDNGLNTVPKLAEREGVPTAIVFRDFDGAGQTPTVMRRFLDQAAFRAGQQGSVVMLGRVQPDTVSALLLWGLQDRSNRVALAPVTALLTKVH